MHSRNPELEDAVASHPEDRDVHLVYADWLQTIGDPQGALIEASIAAADEPARGRKHKLRAKKLLDAFIEDRCIPAYPALEHRFRAWRDESAYQSDKMFGSSVERIDWRWGLIRMLGMNSWPPTLLREGLALARSPLAMFVETVDLWRSTIDDLTPLSGLRCLREINLGRATAVTDITPLAGLHELRRVWLSYNRITTLEPLFELPKLEAFDCAETLVPSSQIAALRERIRSRASSA